VTVLNKNNIIIGIDPGIRNTGWGIINNFENKLQHIDHGVIVPDSEETDATRLFFISSNLDKILNKYKPSLAVIEKIFVSASGESALKLGMARGVALNVIASKKNILIKELAARFVKKAITGSGAADKNQIKFMIEKLLGKEVKNLDASDALAIAIAGANLRNEKLNSYNVMIKSQKKDINNNLTNAINRALDKS
jgi:crossover junction endodeoxyribonuclease RuvC